LRNPHGVVYGPLMSIGRKNIPLQGHSIALDPRIHAVRPDLADVALAERLFAPHYAQALPTRCAAPFAAVCDAPDGEQISEILAGETFMLLDTSGGWSWGYCALDYYVGYVRSDQLDEASPPHDEAPVGDIASAAERFLGMAYVFGGRGGAGIDCSGLVQRSLAATGQAAPRDSDMQQEALGTELPAGTPLARNDLVFFPDHVGIMVDGERMIHATRHTDSVCIEPLADVAARIAARHEQPILARRRLSP
jgi:cell wall-associated NlpC family hydrolase